MNVAKPRREEFLNPQRFCAIHSEDNCDIFSPEFFTDEHTEARDLFNNETYILTMKYLFMHTICTASEI